jgi:hypothetical protein
MKRVLCAGLLFAFGAAAYSQVGDAVSDFINEKLRQEDRYRPVAQACYRVNRLDQAADNANDALNDAFFSPFVATELDSHLQLILDRSIVVFERIKLLYEVGPLMETGFDAPEVLTLTVLDRDIDGQISGNQLVDLMVLASDNTVQETQRVIQREAPIERLGAISDTIDGLQQACRLMLGLDIGVIENSG